MHILEKKKSYQESVKAVKIGIIWKPELYNETHVYEYLNR